MILILILVLIIMIMMMLMIILMMMMLMMMFRYLTPYKENLGRLLEDKDFKSELLNFPLGGEDSQIKVRAEYLAMILDDT